jgi:hypothetical protein
MRARTWSARSATGMIGMRLMMFDVVVLHRMAAMVMRTSGLKVLK